MIKNWNVVFENWKIGNWNVSFENWKIGTNVRMPKMCSWSGGFVMIAESISRQNRALGDERHTVHVRCCSMMLTMPVHRRAVRRHHVCHVHYYPVTFANLQYYIYVVVIFSFNFSFSSSARKICRKEKIKIVFLITIKSLKFVIVLCFLLPNFLTIILFTVLNL